MSELSVEGLSKHFGGVQALQQLTLSVERGERRAIIGPNGAGKSTLFGIITGEVTTSQGRVLLRDQDIGRLEMAERAALGLGVTFQRNNLFEGLTALENLRLAVWRSRPGSRRSYPFPRFFGTRLRASPEPAEKAGSMGWRAARTVLDWFRPMAAFSEITDEVEASLEWAGLSAVRDLKAGELAYGQQRALEIAIALATRPTLMLMDEPTAGMSPGETLATTRQLQELPRTLTLCVIEHDMDVVFSLADRITLLHYGQEIITGSPSTVRNDPRAQDIYLGSL
jgi:branched-chain amino acid transport system ATP-binding protein